MHSKIIREYQIYLLPFGTINSFEYEAFIKLIDENTIIEFPVQWINNCTKNDTLREFDADRMTMNREIIKTVKIKVLVDEKAKIEGFEILEY